MTTKKRDSLSNSGQLSILDILERLDDAARQTDEPVPGSLDCEAEIKAALKEDLRHAQDERGRLLSRAEVAARMTDLVGSEISLTTLNNMTATTHAHRFPVSWLPALTAATGQRRVLEAIARRTGLFVLPGPEAIRAEISRFREEKKELAKEIRKREMYLTDMEGTGDE